MSQSCIITGATGYIGSHLVIYLLERGWNVHIIVRPQSNFELLESVKDKLHICYYDGEVEGLIDYFTNNHIDVVFHIAAAVISSYNPNQISTLIRSNIEFGTHVLEAMKSSETRLIVSTGTYWQNYNSDSYNPVDLYAATKEAFEKILQYYVDAHSFRAITLRLFDVYGEDDRRPKLLNLLRDIAGTEQGIDVSAGEQLLDLVHISDVCSAYLCAYNLLKEDSVINNMVYGVYTGHRISLKNLILLFSETLRKPLKVNIGAKPYKEREIMKPIESYGLLPNWCPLIGIEIGLTCFNNRGGVNLHSLNNENLAA